MDRSNEHKTPAESTSVLTKNSNGEKRRESWNYRSIIRMMSFLVNSTHPELSHAVHQCARFCQDPKVGHETAVKHVVRYLMSTRPRDGREAPKYGMNMRPDLSRGLE
eukprot:14901718-Ditylum_brightwellii.AAC.1